MKISTILLGIFLLCYYTFAVLLWYETLRFEPKVIKEVCIETHQTLNRNETQIVCGKLLPSNKGD